MLMVHSGMAAMTGAGLSGPSKAYDAFLAHITVLATSGSRAWAASSLAAGTDQRTYRTAPSMLDLAGLVMTGSSWGPLSPQGLGRALSGTARAMQHALPSEAVFNALRASGYEILYTVTAASPGEVFAVSRNGYTSSDTGGIENVCRVTEVLYYDPSLGPMRMQPSLGLGPEPYDWT